MPLQPALIDSATGKLYRHTSAGFVSLSDDVAPPAIIASGPATVNEGGDITLTATITEGDASITSIQWARLSGPEQAAAVGLDAAVCTITTAAVGEDTAATWQCTAQDANGLTASASHTFIILDVLPLLTGASFASPSVVVAGQAELLLTFARLPPSATTSITVTLTPESTLAGPSGSTTLSVTADAEGLATVLVPYTAQTADVSATCGAQYLGVSLTASVAITAPPAAVDVIDDDFTGTAGTTILSRSSEGWQVVTGAAGEMANSWVLDASGQASWSPSGGDAGVGTATIGCQITDAPGVRLKWKHVTLGSCRFHLFGSDQNNAIVAEISGAGVALTIRNLVAGVTTTAGSVTLVNSDGGGAALASGDVFEVRLLRSGNTITDQALYRNGVRIAQAVAWAWSPSLVLGTACGRSTRSRSGVEDDIKIGPIESVAIDGDPAFTAAAFSPAEVVAGNPSTLTLSFSGLAASSTVSVPVTVTPDAGLAGPSGSTTVSVTTNALGTGSGTLSYSPGAAGTFGVSVLAYASPRTATLTANAAANAAPTVSISAPFSATEGGQITLVASAADGDGTIASYTWAQTAGPTASIVSGAGTATLVLTAPAVSGDSAITMQCTVADNVGATAAASRTVAIIDSAGPAPSTWDEAGILWANAPPTRDFAVTRVFADAAKHIKSFAPLTDEYSATARVPCKSNGYPEDGQSFACIFKTKWVDGDAGVYTIQFDGQAASFATYTGCSLGAMTYSPITGKTSGTLTVADGTNLAGLRFNNVSGFAGLKIMRPGYALDYAGKIRTEVATHLATFSGLRFLDVLLTNDSSNAANANWSTSYAGGGDDPVRYKFSLRACFDMAAANSQDVWVLVPATATDDYIAAFVAECAALKQAGQKVVIEFSNERWNFAFAAWGVCGVAACEAAGTRTGNPAQPNRIVSAARSGGVVTMAFNTAHALTVGAQVYCGGIAGLTSGLKTVASVPNANTITYSETGADAVGGISTSFNSYCHTNLSHPLTARLTNWGSGTTYPSSYHVKERWELARLKAIYDAIVAAGQTATMKVVMGTQLGLSTNSQILAWAAQTYGSATWIHALAPAYYSSPTDDEAMTTADLVFEQLELTMPAKLTSLLRQRNSAANWGVGFWAYEGGPHTDIKPNDTVNAAIAAAHVDDRMRLHIKRILTEWRAVGGGPFAYFASGCTDTFGGYDNNTWAMVLGAVTNGPSQAKYKAMLEMAGQSATAAPIDGMTWGAIPLGYYLPRDVGGGGESTTRIISTTEVFGDLPVLVMCPAAGTYTVELRACQSKASGQWVTLLLDGVVVADQIALPVQTPVSGGTFPSAVSISVAMTQGPHDIAIRLRNDTRTATIGLGTLTLS